VTFLVPVIFFAAWALLALPWAAPRLTLTASTAASVAKTVRVMTAPLSEVDVRATILRNRII